MEKKEIKNDGVRATPSQGRGREAIFTRKKGLGGGDATRDVIALARDTH